VDDGKENIKVNERLKRVLRDRTAQTLALGVVFIVLLGFVRPPAMVDRVGIDHTYLFLKKTHSPKQYDVIIAGDSRAYCSLSPAVMRQELRTEASILNFGFEANGYTEVYMKGIDHKLKKADPSATVVLAFTPMTLVPSTAYWNGYESCLEKTGWPLYRDMYMPRMLRFFDPYEWRYVYRKVMGEVPVRMIWRYDPDGFVSVEQLPETREVDLAKQHNAFKNNQVKDERIELVMSWVKKWTSQGIAVYGYRPPANPKVVKIENHESGFDEPDIVSRFEKAGGIWVRADGKQYGTYDGYHLLGHEAERFSSHFADVMLADGWKQHRGHLTSKKSPPPLSN
jgi:hypothetical protein